jgi:hypothetical protein
MNMTEIIAHETKGMTPWEAGRMRESMLATGLRTLGAKHGLLFREPLQIDSNGEFSLAVDHDVHGYGQPFVDLLNRHNPRTGILPTKHMDPRNGWCRINHFDVERMLNEGLA